MSSERFTAEQDEAWRAFLHTSALLTSRLDDEMRAEHGERLATFDVLSNLSEVPNGELRMSDLADQSLFSRSRLSYTVNQLEARGLVKRRTDAEDKRGITAVLTPDGQAYHRKLARTHLEGIRKYFLDPTSTTSRSNLTEALAPILEALDNEHASPT
jgi:DNA-binding MarR family transcriptional regulator